MLLLIPLLVLPGLSPAMRPFESAALDAPTRHVRALDSGARRALRDGYRRSATFASIVDRLQSSDVVVYVSMVPQLPWPCQARSEMISGAPHRRFVQVDVAVASDPDRTIALVAHELRHALEIADAANVVDDTGMERLYKRIGTPSGPHAFETKDALAAERQVRKELLSRG